jgi:hypothetical protein
MKWGLHYWPGYLTVASLFFLVPELFALATNPANTLSDYCWHELDVTRALEFTMHSVAWYASLAAWIVFVLVITLHIWFRSVLWNHSSGHCGMRNGDSTTRWHATCILDVTVLVACSFAAVSAVLSLTFP